VANFAERKQEIEDARDAFKTVQQVLVSLKDADDPHACLEAGRYYCLIKGEWDTGLPLLARCSDLRLRELAEEELREPNIGGDQLELADGWWELGGDDTSQQKALRLRAAHWYARARDTLPAGLFRVKAEMRLRQIKKEYGQSALDAAINGRAR
jgi:hypothetical protein